MTYTTLEYLGAELALADWGIAEEGCVKHLANLEQDTFRLMVPKADVFDDPIWPFEGTVIIRSGRSLSDGIYSGGVIEFTGKRLLHVIDGRPNFEGVYYNFAGPWYDIAQTPYQQKSAWWLGPVDQTEEGLSSDVLLFFKLVDHLYTTVTTKTQILETLQHVLDEYSAQGLDEPFQVTVGDIDVDVNLPSYRMQDVKCAEVIEYCLRPSPDARLWFDYTTSPPTAKVTSRSNCAPVTIALADGMKHESLRITPRPDLQARSVVLFFKQTNQVDSTSWMVKTKIKHGPNGANSDLDPEGGLRVIVQTIDLQGFSVSNVYGSLETLAVSNDLAFWSVVIPELASTQVRFFSMLTGMTVTDETGASVSLASYPNALMDGSSICPWMTLGGGTPVTGKRVTITADATYKLFDVEATGGDRTALNGTFLEWFQKKRLSWRGTITNGVTGDYSTTASSITAETIPANMAQKIYESLQTLQYEGDVTIVEENISGGVHMGNSLNLSGGRAEWATMNAQIQSITKDFGTGRTTVTIGPARFLSAGDLTQLFLVNRMRRVYENPMTRASGMSPASGNTVGLGKNSARENTGTGLNSKAFLRLTYTQEA